MANVKRVWKIVPMLVMFGFIYCVKGVDILGKKVHFNNVIELSASANSDAHAFDSFAPMQLSECIKKCERIQACKFINYFWRFHYCVLITAYSSTMATTIYQPGAWYANKSDWTISTLPTECQSCRYYEECVTLPPSNHTCVKKGCGNPMFVEDATRYGNMFRFGNKIKYVCDVSGTSVVKVCQEDEQWSNSTFVCEVPTTTTLAPTPAPCVPAISVSYQTGTLSDGDSFTYFIKFLPMSRAQAFAYCNSTCGQLVEVVTTEKHAFLKNILQTNTVYNNLRFYIDGTYDSTDKEWYTNSGNIIPKSASFWQNSDSHDGGHGSICVTMVEHSFALEDNNCADNYRVICEQV